MTQQARPVSIHLKLYTDAPLRKLLDPDVWRDLMLGKNPTWVDDGRQAIVRIQSISERDEEKEAVVQNVSVTLGNEERDVDSLREDICMERLSRAVSTKPARPTAPQEKRKPGRPRKVSS